MLSTFQVTLEGFQDGNLGENGQGRNAVEDGVEQGEVSHYLQMLLLSDQHGEGYEMMSAYDSRARITSGMSVVL